MYVDNGKSGGADYDSVRTQIPITATRALTFYKAQGLTLERVFYEVDPFSGRDADASHRHSTGKSTCSG